MQPIQTTESPPPKSESALPPDLEERLWRRLYSAAEDPTVASILVEHLTDQESAYSRRALYLVAIATTDRHRRRQIAIRSLIHLVTLTPRWVLQLGSKVLALRTQKGLIRQGIVLAKTDPDAAASFAASLRVQSSGAASPASVADDRKSA